jgi:hypothetical protein
MADSKPTSGSAPPPRCSSERVGRFDMAVACAELSPEAAERWARRAEVLARWLLAAWKKDHQGSGRE